MVNKAEDSLQGVVLEVCFFWILLTVCHVNIRDFIVFHI